MGAYVTVIGPSESQVEYRLTGHSGCGEDARLGYYLDAPERPLRWIGRGGSDLGLNAGAVLDSSQHDAARAVMRGVHPFTGERLVAPKTAVAPAALLPAAPLVDAVLLEATRRGASAEGLWATQGVAEEWGRVVRGVARLGQAHRISVARAARLLDAAGLEPEAAYDGTVFDTAARHAGERAVVGNRGYDLTLTLPKSFSVLAAFADEQTSARMEEIFLRAGEETLAYAEDIAGYGLRGRHGGGWSARRVAGRGFVGWVTVHRTARPTVPGLPGDPHLHAHYTIANLVHGTDGRWSTVAAGGRDLLAHARVLGEFITARVRRLSAEELGLSWSRDPVSGQWEIAGITREAIDRFSKRGTQVGELLAELGLTPQTATPTQRRIASRITRPAKDPHTTSTPDRTLRNYWRREARAAGIDPEQLVAASEAARGPLPARLSDTALAGAVFDPDSGVTAHDADFARRDLLAALADSVPDGLADTADLEQLTDRLLTHPEAVPMPARPGTPAHLSNTARYTTADLIASSTRIIETTTAGLNTGTAVVPADVAARAEHAHETVRGYPLSGEQRAVYQRLVGAGHRVDVVIGVAGSGKTTVTATARTAWEATGMTVRGAALAAVGADALRDAGIPSTTIASLTHPDRPLDDKLAEVDVLVLDEASQIGVRDLDVLLTAAARTGTKIVQIGDPRQLGSPVPGGALAAQHRAVGGLTLAENRRQRSLADRRAAESWRNGDYRDALTAWQATDQVVTTHTRAQSLHAALSGWAKDSVGYPDRFDRLNNVLLMATRNSDVAELNTAARALARVSGDLTGPDQVYPLTSGGALRLAVGDVVMTRVNDYRAWRDAGPDVLNGRRGYVDHINPDTGEVTVTWRSPDGVHQATLTADYIAGSGLEHGYALTVYKAQGHTADVAHTYGGDLNAHTTYVAQTRARHRATLYLPATELADPITHSPDDIAAMNEQARADLAAAILAETAQHTRDQKLVTEELANPQPGTRELTAPVRHTPDGTPSPTHASRRESYLAAVDADLHTRLRTDPALPALLTRLDDIAEHGYDPASVLAQLAAQHDVSTATSAAKVLHWRVTRWLHSHTPDTGSAGRREAGCDPLTAADRLRSARRAVAVVEDPAAPTVRDLSENPDGDSHAELATTPKIRPRLPEGEPDRYVVEVDDAAEAT